MPDASATARWVALAFSLPRDECLHTISPPFPPFGLNIAFDAIAAKRAQSFPEKAPHLESHQNHVPPSQANTTVVSQRSSLVVENRVAIRFTRMGRKKLPFYRIVAIDSKKRRDGAPLEYLGWYDPMKKEANLNAPAIRKWLSVGAQPSETVSGLLKKAMVIEQ